MNKHSTSDDKGIVHPEIQICWQFTHPQVIQDADEFVSSSEQIWRNLASHHLLINGSSAVNGCHQSQRNPQEIHTTPVHQLMSCEARSCMFV